MGVRWRSILAHLTFAHARARRTFSADALSRIEQLVREGETRHDAELRVVIEAALPVGAALSGTNPALRARQVFGEIGVWDTERNTGVLLYLNLAEHRVEILPDRHARDAAPQPVWAEACDAIATACASGREIDGLCDALSQLNRQLATYLPHIEPRQGDSNLPDAPLLR